MTLSPSEKLDVYEFGTELLVTNDLDPIYVVLWHGELGQHLLCRWLLAYWCYYHAGTASAICDSNSYWPAMAAAAATRDWPRGMERRHFRGKLATSSVAWLEERGVERLFAPFLNGNDWTLGAAVKEIKKWRGFGDWIAFKVADMLERLGLTKIFFADADAFLFDSPQEGAKMMWIHETGGSLGKTHNPSDAEVQTWAVESLVKKFHNVSAPPGYERKVNAQEAETILCKWKSYMKGHYELGEDIKALRTGLLRFAKSSTSQRLIKAGRAGGLWET